MTGETSCKAYDTADHVAKLRAAGITPHVTQNNGLTKTGRQRRSAIDGRTIRHGGYAASQSRRPMIECIFGWGKQHGTMRKTKHRGIRQIVGDEVEQKVACDAADTAMLGLAHRAMLLAPAKDALDHCST